jgi:hypothetical protein
MEDEWRLQVTFAGSEWARAFVGRLDAGLMAHDLRSEFHEKVIVSRDEACIFVYAGSRRQIEKAAAAILGDARKHGWNVGTELRRWHPAAEAWEKATTPLPTTDATRHVEREALMARERAAVRENGYPEFEVRADLPSHVDVIELSKRLEGEGYPAVHRWRYLVVGATDEDNAEELARRIGEEAPPGSHVRVEGTWQAVRHYRPNPFVLMPSS